MTEKGEQILKQVQDDGKRGTDPETSSG